MAELSSPDESELMRRIRAKDQSALNILYDRYINLVFDLAYFILRNPGWAEEVSQDAFLKVWTQAHQWDPSRGGLPTWLLTITRYTAIDRLRKENRRPSWGAADIDDLLNSLSSGEAVGDVGWQDAQFVREMMNTLPPEQREVVELAFFGGLTHTEMAETLKLPLGTVKGRVRAGLQKMRDLWLRYEAEA
jgi:RNA polymerase sigma-70 factor (ECF subfamily)